MKEKFEDIVDFCIDHYPSIIGVIAIIATGVLAVTSASTVAGYEAQLPELRKSIDDAKTELNKESTVEDDVEAMKVSTINARDIGNEVVKAQMVVADSYATHETPSEDDIAKAEEALKVIAKNVEGEARSNMWLRNSEWTFELKSVVNYTGVTSMPVIFTMTTTNGQLAGLVRAVYDSEAEQFKDVKVQYTAIGREEFSDVGGN